MTIKTQEKDRIRNQYLHLSCERHLRKTLELFRSFLFLVRGGHTCFTWRAHAVNLSHAGDIVTRKTKNKEKHFAGGLVLKAHAVQLSCIQQRDVLHGQNVPEERHQGLVAKPLEYVPIGNGRFSLHDARRFVAFGFNKWPFCEHNKLISIYISCHTPGVAYTNCHL